MPVASQATKPGSKPGRGTCIKFRASVILNCSPPVYLLYLRGWELNNQRDLGALNFTQVDSMIANCIVRGKSGLRRTR